MIDLTPVEVRKKKGDFRKALRGYEPALVDDFLDIVADRLEQLVRENAALSERLARLEQQVADFRDRERALTDALVTAQEMREEIREQTAREADLVKRTALQEAETRVRDAEQHAEKTVREALQTAEDRTRKAQQEAERLVRSAQQDAERTLRVAEQQASQLRTEAIRVREQEEELLRRLRARQQQLLTSYRSFLERELAELNVITESLDLAKDALAAADAVPIEAVGPAPVLPSAAETLAGGPGVGAAAAPAARPEPEPDLLRNLTILDPGAPVPFDTPRPAARPAPPMPALESALRGPDPFEDPLPVELPPALPLESALPFEPEEPEPFEPEPVYEEDLPPRELRVAPGKLLHEDPELEDEFEETLPEAWDDPPEPAAPAQLDLPVDRAPDPASEPAAVDEAGAAADAAPEGPEDDEAADTLLENAARAGYHFDLEDDQAEAPELLLEDAAEDEEPGDDDWLSSVIEERK